jgi:uncharacterized protein (TIGR02145 family)
MECLNCKKDILANSKFCPECGWENDSPKIICLNQNCGRKDLTYDAKFCPDCGTKIKDEFVGNSGTFIDERDGHVYKWERIGTQIWIAENLAYEIEEGCWIYDNKQKNLWKYGRLYNWESALAACPSGWHLPSKEEWTVLENFLLSNGCQYKSKYRAVSRALASTSGWEDSDKTGTPGYIKSDNNKSGFNAKPGGCRNGKGFLGFDEKKECGNWWTSSDDLNEAYSYYLEYDERHSYLWKRSKKKGYSVRCIKDESKSKK